MNIQLNSSLMKSSTTNAYTDINLIHLFRLFQIFFRWFFYLTPFVCLFLIPIAVLYSSSLFRFNSLSCAYRFFPFFA